MNSRFWSSQKKFSDNRRQCDILLIHPPWFRLQDSNLVPFPVGPCYIAAILEKAGLDALVWNGDYDYQPTLSMGGTNMLNTQELVQSHTRLLSRLEAADDPVWQDVESIVRLIKPKIVGISAYSASFPSAQRVAKIVKRINPEIVTILGGMHPTIERENLFSQCDCFDVMVVGEAEKSAPPLFSKLLQGEKIPQLQDIPGLIFRSGQEVIFTGEVEPIANLDEIPWPARHRLIDLDKMPPSAHQAIYGFRGCPFQCIFCGSHNMFGRKPRIRSAENVVSEMEFVHREYRTKYFYICDDLFLYDKERVIEFCSLLKERGLNIYYTLQTRGEMLDESLLPQLKETGCQHIAVGVEVGNEEIRKKIKKGNKNEEIRNANRLIKKYRLRMSGFFMFGFPWETREQMLETVEFMEELNPCVAFPYIVTPAPGTELLNIARAMELIPLSLDLSSFAHTSPKMGLTTTLSETEKEQLIDEILARFSKHNKKSLQKDLWTRPIFYLYAARDAGLFESPKILLKYFSNLFS